MFSFTYTKIMDLYINCNRGTKIVYFTFNIKNPNEKIIF
jgi:hypothetical protein